MIVIAKVGFAVWFLLMSIWFQNYECLMENRLTELKEKCRRDGQLVDLEDIRRDYQAGLVGTDVTKEFLELAKKITDHKKFQGFDRVLRRFDQVTEDQLKEVGVRVRMQAADLAKAVSESEE